MKTEHSAISPTCLDDAPDEVREGLLQAACVWVDLRLATQLLDRAGTNGLVPLTHQSLASDLGTAGKAVSRSLKRWQQAGRVELERGAVRLVNALALRDLSKPKPPSPTQ